MSWTEEKVAKLKELWGKGNTASQIAEIIGGISRNAVIGKAHRLNLSAKIKTRSVTSNENFNNSVENKNNKLINKGRRSKFKSLLIDKDFEPENPKQLEELDENSCKWPIGHPDENDFYFCGRTSLKDFSYCKLHLLYAYQPKGKKDEVTEKDEVPEFIEKKISSAFIFIYIKSILNFLSFRKLTTILPHITVFFNFYIKKFCARDANIKISFILSRSNVVIL